MAQRLKRCQCCGKLVARSFRVCTYCQTPFERFRMNHERVKLCHVLAHKKGLDDETYRLRLNAVGVKSSKQMTKAQYLEFVKNINTLPDMPRKNEKAD